MVLNDITNDYLFVYSNLNECKQYFAICTEIKHCYLHNVSTSIAKYFKNYGLPNSKDSLSSELSTSLQKCFTLITKLNSVSYKFFSCLGTLNSTKYYSNNLLFEIKELNAHAEKTIESVNAIKEAQITEFKKLTLLEEFIFYSENYFTHIIKYRMDTFYFLN